ncbi:MAG: hypothetical protein V4773_27435, partial [Verrucomicrobiota bacterium]
MTPKPIPSRPGVSSPKRMLQAALLAVSATAALPVYTRAADNTATASTGVVSGSVTNKSTGNGLIGARVDIPALNLGAVVDNTGRYLIKELLGEGDDDPRGPADVGE